LRRTDYRLNGDELGIGLIHVFRFSISILSFISIGVSFRRFSHRWNIGQIQKDIYLDTILALIWSLSSISNTIPLFHQEDSICEIYDNQANCIGVNMILVLFSWIMSILLMVSALIITKRWRRYNLMVLKLHNTSSPSSSNNNNNNNFKTITTSANSLTSATMKRSMSDSSNKSIAGAIGAGVGGGSGLGNNGILATANLTSSPSSSPTTPNSKVVMQEGVLENGQPILVFHQNNLHMFSQKKIFLMLL
jgi:hypothetical protein